MCNDFAFFTLFLNYLQKHFTTHKQKCQCNSEIKQAKKALFQVFFIGKYGYFFIKSLYRHLNNCIFQHHILSKLYEFQEIAQELCCYFYHFASNLHNKNPRIKKSDSGILRFLLFYNLKSDIKKYIFRLQYRV